MKRFYIMIMILLLPTVAFSQAKRINAILDKYENREDVTSIQLNAAFIGSFLSSLVDDETKDLVSKINAIRILSLGAEKSSDTATSLKRELYRAVDSGEMENIVNMKEGGQSVVDVFVSRDSKEVLLFVSSNTKEFTVISMFGNIDKKVISAVVSGKISIKK